MVKWGGAVALALLVVAWVGSRWVGVVVWKRDGLLFSCEAGRLCACADGTDDGVAWNLGWGVDVGSFPFRWRLDWIDEGLHGYRKAIPLWIPVLVVVLPTCAAWRLDAVARRVRMGFCSKCDYSRAGLPLGSVCPECGAAANQPPVRA